MLFGDCGPHGSGLVKRVSDFHLLCLINESFHKFQVDSALHKNPRGIGAHLALGEKVGHHGTLDGVFQIGVLKDDQRGFASQLQSHVFYALRSGLHDLCAGGHGAGEADLGHIWMTGKVGSGFTLALNDVQDTAREAAFFEDLINKDVIWNGYNFFSYYFGK